MEVVTENVTFILSKRKKYDKWLTSKKEGGLRGVESLFQIVSFAETYEVLDIFASIVGEIAG